MQRKIYVEIIMLQHILDAAQERWMKYRKEQEKWQAEEEIKAMLTIIEYSSSASVSSEGQEDDPYIIKMRMVRRFGAGI